MTEDDWRWHMYDTVKGSDWLGKVYLEVRFSLCLLALTQCFFCMNKPREAQKYRLEICSLTVTVLSLTWTCCTSK